MTEKKLKQGNNRLAEIDDGLSKNYQRPSTDLISEYIARGGGEAFGRPLGLGELSLTEKVVKFFKQKSFFGFESFEKPKRKTSNKFTRYGSSPYKGKLQDPRKTKKTPRGK